MARYQVRFKTMKANTSSLQEKLNRLIENRWTVREVLPAGLDRYTIVAARTVRTRASKGR